MNIKTFIISKIFVLSLVAFFLFPSGLMAEKVATITYSQVVNGRSSDRGGKTVVVASPDFAITYTERDRTNLIPQTPEEKNYIDYKQKLTWQVAQLYDGTSVYMKSGFAEYPEFVVTDETAVIAGYTCRKATASLRSNSLEIWFTTEAGVKGTPQPSFGIPDGLVLKTVRNGNFEVVAQEVVFEQKQVSLPELPKNLGESADQALYRHRVTESYIETIRVFDEAQLSWGNPIQNPVTDTPDSIWHFAGGTVVAKKVVLPKVSPDYLVFAELRQYSNGDAYDRTGSVFIIPQDKEQSMLDALKNGIDNVPVFHARNGKSYQGMMATPEFDPAIELVRFFTPFGVRQFNEQVKVFGQEWEEVAYYKQDITELLSELQGEVWIGAFIGNYDKGGHKISLDLKYYPGSPQVREQEAPRQYVAPLFNTLNFMEMAGQNYGTFFDQDSLTVEFTVPEGVSNLRLRYITTGHGGWGGGDEFNQKMNSIFIDGQLAYSFIPWRTDCGTFRKYNPASGNFWNGVTSSDYSRSGWCPGGITDPNYIQLDHLKPGKHIMKVAIPQGAPQGNSFSAWCISGVLIGDLK